MRRFQGAYRRDRERRHQRHEAWANRPSRRRELKEALMWLGIAAHMDFADRIEIDPETGDIIE